MSPYFKHLAEVQHYFARTFGVFSAESVNFVSSINGWMAAKQYDAQLIRLRHLKFTMSLVFGSEAIVYSELMQ